ncbi:MAG: polyprenyl diphosphate synthase [Chloroflexota bacterium]
MSPSSGSSNSCPQHVAIIMDGNGRWAQQQGLPRLEGHRAGVANIRRVTEAFVRDGVRYLTLFAFSTENWGRPKQEVRGLFRLLGQVIDREAKFFHTKGIKLRHLGRLDSLSATLRTKVEKAVGLTKDNQGMILNVAFDYGGRAEIMAAVRELLIRDLSPQELTEDIFERYLYTAGLPDPDLIIRTSGELRVSNFLLWQGAYSEFYFTAAFWPDFDEKEVSAALKAYSQRQRRFGGLKA